jgi:hypothetical protein
MLTLPVPPAVISAYLVPTSAPPDDVPTLAREAVRTHVAGPLRDHALQLLSDPLLGLGVQPVGRYPALESPWLHTFGAQPPQLRPLRTATHVISVRNAYEPAAHQWVGCAVASALARTLDVPVVDEFMPRLLDAEQLESSLPDRDGVLPVSRWIEVLESPDEDGYWCTTFGLARFGLPELQTHEVPPHLAGDWAWILTGLAQRLLQSWTAERRARRGASFVELRDVVGVTPEDVAVAYGRQPEGTGRADIRLRLDTEGATEPVFLTVLPPAEFDGSPADHLLAVRTALVGTAEQIG